MFSNRLSALLVQAQEIRLGYLREELELGLEFARISRTKRDLDPVSADRLVCDT
jgi:hypothetical protein